MKRKILLPIIILSGQFILLNAQTRIPARERFNWKDFNTSSSVDKDSIDYNVIQGNWIAFQGIHVGDHDIGWVTNDKPKSLQIKGDKYRKTLGGEFYPLQLDKNLIIFHCEDNQVDSAYINLVTEKELTISFKRGIDYDQYQYKK